MIHPETGTPSSTTDDRPHMPRWFIPAVTALVAFAILSLGSGFAPADGMSPGAMLNLLVGSLLGSTLLVQQFKGEIVEVGRAAGKAISRVGRTGIAKTDRGAAMVQTKA